MADDRKRPPTAKSRLDHPRGIAELSEPKRSKHSHLGQLSGEEEGEIRSSEAHKSKHSSHSSQRHHSRQKSGGDHYQYPEEDRERRRGSGQQLQRKDSAKLSSQIHVGDSHSSSIPARASHHHRDCHGNRSSGNHHRRDDRHRDDGGRDDRYGDHQRTHRSEGELSRESSQDRERLHGKTSSRGQAEDRDDLRRVLERKRREEHQMVSDVSSEEERRSEDLDSESSSDGEISDDEASSRSTRSSSRSSNSSGGSGGSEDRSSRSSAREVGKESRWLSRDSASDLEDDGGGESGGRGSQDGGAKGSRLSAKDLRRQIGGYGLKEEDLSGSEEEEEEGNATPCLDENTKELNKEGAEPGVIEVSCSPETPKLPDYYPGIHGCRSVETYEWLNKIEEGTYGVVSRGREKRTNDVVAIKKLKMEKEKDGFPITSLREVCCLLKAKHKNVVNVREIVVGSSMDKIYIVMDFIEHDLKALMETMKQPFLAGEVKTLLQQLLEGIHHLHDNWILHRDLKTSNLLLSHKGILKIGDFGLARDYGSPLKPYTPVVVTLWYRCPELLLGEKLYSTAVDMWSVGCIFGELLLHKPLFQGKSQIDQLNKIFQEMGTPNEKIWPKYPELPHVKEYSFKEQPYLNLRKKLPIAVLTNSGFDLVNRFLTYDPDKRVTAETALQHEYFQESPLPVDPSLFPTWPAKSENGGKRERSPSAPLGGGAFMKNLADEDDSAAFSLSSTTAVKGRAASGPGFTLKF